MPEVNWRTMRNTKLIFECAHCHNSNNEEKEELKENEKYLQQIPLKHNDIVCALGAVQVQNKRNVVKLAIVVADDDDNNNNDDALSFRCVLRQHPSATDTQTPPAMTGRETEHNAMLNEMKLLNIGAFRAAIQCLVDDDSNGNDDNDIY